MEELTLDAKVEHLDQVLALVDGLLEKRDCPMKTQMQIDVAVEELFVNIANYAYTPQTGQATVRARLLDEPSAIEVTLIDSGMPYNPLAKEDPDITLPVEERPIGGLGIYMVKKSMDKVHYEHKDGQNVLTFLKCL
ncbi:MAG: ATP-binding protein [Lachnospiraceae bacterium]|nr:ATP-binding protein [Lachnospiraceae bacterium]